MNVTHTRGPSALVLVAGLLAGLLLPLTVATAPSAQAATRQATAQYAINNLLTVREETNAGYERAKFRHWIDANGDCQDTRAEVLIQESRTSTTGGCTIRSGRWSSYYDRRVWTNASDVDIDHLVALAEAWGSGAKQWTADTRKRFANDLIDKRTLVAVTDDVNQAKGAQDPAQWLPRYDKCRYVREWVAVKLRWKLTINTAEKSALLRVQGSCTNTTITWTPATVNKATSSDGSSSTTSGLRLTKVVYNPDGDERNAPNTEKVYIKNVSSRRRAC
ncbi:HNH endonuclease family protein [Promicromonospora soli]